MFQLTKFPILECKIHHNAQQSDNNSSFIETRINIQGNIGSTGVSGQGEEGFTAQKATRWTIRKQFK